MDRFGFGWPDFEFGGGQGGGGAVSPADVLPNGRMWVGQYDDSSVTVTMSSVDNVDQIRLAAVPVSGGGTVVSDPITVDPTYDFARTTLTGLAAAVRSGRTLLTFNPVAP